MVHELRLRAPQQQVTDLSDALDALDALSVSVEDADAASEQEQPLFGEPGLPPPQDGWNRSLISALFATREAAEDAVRLLSPQDFFAECEVTEIREVAEQDWVSLTQSQFAPVAITPSFWIVPTWHTPPPEAREVIRLDPGMAFGTGTHPTTFMCLQWIARDRGAHALGRVLDYGCGSGILGIAAAKCAATHIDAVDIDPAAVEASARNAQANGVALHCGLPDAAEGVYDTVLANILATPLKVLAPLLRARMAPGGWLVLAGILERQAQELSEAYAPYLPITVAARREGWVLMAGRAPGTSTALS